LSWIGQGFQHHSVMIQSVLTSIKKREPPPVNQDFHDYRGTDHGNNRGIHIYVLVKRITNGMHPLNGNIPR
jgi:hypothetical protein